MSLSLSICILSWKAHSTLRNTLSSYKEKGLLDLTDDVIIFFQECSKEDGDIAREFDIPLVIGDETNVGIGEAFKRMIECAKYKTVLVLENDWVLQIPTKSETEAYILDSITLLDSGMADFVRLRHNKVPGVPLYTAQFHGREMDSPEHLIEQVHFLGSDLSLYFPDKFWYTIYSKSGFVIGDSKFSNYSNNPFMCKKDFWLKNVAPHSGVAGQNETLVRDSWIKGGYNVAFNIPGLFTHKRVDR